MKYILPEPREKVFGSLAVPCFIEIGSHNLHVRHNFIMLMFLQFAVSFAFIPRMISVPRFRWELMKNRRSLIVLWDIESFPLFSLWAICHCWLIAVKGPACLIGWLQTLYVVMSVTHLFYLPLIVALDHLHILLGSAPCLVILGCNVGWKMIWFHQVYMMMTTVLSIGRYMLMILSIFDDIVVESCTDSLILAVRICLWSA